MRSKEEINAVVLKHMRLNVSELEHTVIDSSKSMIEYGANSLDLMEIVSSSLRELGLKVPRTEMADLRNIDDFVELLWRHQSAKYQAAAGDGERR